MPPDAPRILVTGATGFIGRRLCDVLAHRDVVVHRTSRVDRRWPDGTWHRFDLLRDEPGPLLDAVRPDAIVHLAWVAPPADYRHHPDNPRFAEATRRLALTAAARGVPRQILVGSSVEGRAPLPYAEAKLALREALCADLTGSWCWARPFLVYGPGEASTRLVPTLARALTRGHLARLGPGTAVRDFIHVEDVAFALASLIESDTTGIIDLGTGRATSVAQVARMIARLAGRPDAVHLGALPPRPEPPRLVADTRALRALDTLPRIPLELGLGEALALHRHLLEHAA